jgi:hypothetical protein
MHGPCALCDQHSESIDHLLVGCRVFAGGLVLHAAYLGETALGANDRLVDWWLWSRKRITKEERKGFDSFVLLIAWSLWKERNARVYDAVLCRPHEVVAAVRASGRLWVTAGFLRLSSFL